MFSTCEHHTSKPLDLSMVTAFEHAFTILSLPVRMPVNAGVPMAPIVAKFLASGGGWDHCCNASAMQNRMVMDAARMIASDNVPDEYRPILDRMYSKSSASPLACYGTYTVPADAR